jgi:hypothetical protein
VSPSAKSAQKAHRQAVETTLEDLVRSLEEMLGRTLVAEIANVDPKTVSRWAEGKAAPRADAEGRVRTAFQVAQLLLSRDSEHTVRAWFIGLNPQLDDTSPAEALKAGQLREVLVAAKSFTLGG